MKSLRSLLLFLFVVSVCPVVVAEPLAILELPATGTDPGKIDYAALPTLPGKLAIINAAALGPHAKPTDQIDMHHLRLNLHNYLAYHQGKFWCIWSDGPKVEDWPTQEIKYSVSEDGLTWSKPQSVTGTPKPPYAFIARGLWVRDGELIALAAHYREKGAFGPQATKQLELVAYRYNSDKNSWELKGQVYDNAINNFPPQKLPSGDWIITRRDSRFNVSVLIGGRKSISDWESFPVVEIGEVKGFRPDEPIFWPLPDKSLYALFRDNGGSQRLFHSVSKDQGRTWDTPVLTNFPNSSSKLYSMLTSRGYRVIVLNAHPSLGRRELHLAISADGKNFTRLARLDIPTPPSIPTEVSRIKKKFSAGIASLQYPHVIEHEGRLLIAFSRGKMQTEVFHVNLDDIDALLKKPDNAAAPKAEQQTVAQAEPRRVIVAEQDWTSAPQEPITPQTIDAFIAQEMASPRKPALLDDEQFLRRLSLDLTGRLPDPAEVIAFVADTDPAKRAKRIDQLLESEAYARHWARYWRDVVSARLTLRRTMGLTRTFEEWMFEQLRANNSWEQITRSIITAEGEVRFSQTLTGARVVKRPPGWLDRPTVEGGDLFFLVAHDGDQAEERAAETSRVFLGIQIQCAQCHDHPSDPWKREQFHEFAAYFARIKYEQLFIEKKLSGVQLVTLEEGEHQMTSLEDPDTSSLTHPRFLNGQSPGEHLSDRERRAALAASVVDKRNHWFAAAYVNRVWHELMGHSFYDHVDDLGPMKEVIFPDALTGLTASFQATDYDMKQVFRTLLNSDTYQRQVRLGDGSTEHLQLATAYPPRLRADTLWDSLGDVLGPIDHATRYFTKGGVRFNRSFQKGKFQAEYDFDPSMQQEEVKGTIPQALFLMNNAAINHRLQVTRDHYLVGLLADQPNDTDAVKAIYLRTFARQPTDRELMKCLAYIGQVDSRKEAFEDLLWALINSTEFQTKH